MKYLERVAGSQNPKADKPDIWLRKIRLIPDFTIWWEGSLSHLYGMGWFQGRHRSECAARRLSVPYLFSVRRPG